MDGEVFFFFFLKKKIFFFFLNYGDYLRNLNCL